MLLERKPLNSTNQNGSEMFQTSEDEKANYDVGILGWWYGKNYGSILTYYGLNRALSNLGYKVLMVHEPLGYNNWRVRWPDDILSVQFAKRVGYHFTNQEHFSKLPKLNEKARTFLVGSDQLWNPRIGRVNDDLFLDFVQEGNRRIAYATSFGNRGTQKFTPGFVEKHSVNLQKFDAISVREKYAVDTAANIFGVEATQVVDPVFLLPASDYEALAAKSTIKMEGEYLAVFFLDPTPDKSRVAEAVADKLGFKRIVVIPNPDDGRKLAKKIFQGDQFEILGEDAPENFLNVYANAGYVITDSFHGTAFSVIFKKPFSSIYNTKRGADRFKSLMDFLGLGESRRVKEEDTEDEIRKNSNISIDIDFSSPEKRVEEERKKSLRWLEQAMAARQTNGGLLHSIGRKYRSLSPFGGKDIEAQGQNRLTFVTNNNAWAVETKKKSTHLSVRPGGSARGNLVWCELPFKLTKGEAYRITITWVIRTSARALNVHVRNADTEEFQVVGRIEIGRKRNVQRSDMVDFIATSDDFTQFMLGAVHFSGEAAGAEIYKLTLTKIEASDIERPAKNGPSPAEKAWEVALLDNDRFVNAYAQNMVSRSDGNARAVMMFHSHAIEKGLSHSDFRPGFGKISVPKLAAEMNKWKGAGNSTEDAFFRVATSVMRSYFDRHSALGFDVSNFRSLFVPAVLEEISKSDGKQGGVLQAHLQRETPISSNYSRDFLDVVSSRRSVREFTSVPVGDESLQHAIQVAMQAPSVCNRQAARVHLFENKDTIASAVKLQGGFGGYKMPPRLLLVTCDLAAYLFAVERNQAFVDGGLFMMALLLGLENAGLGACSLNTAMGPERENKLRKMLNIPESEVFISFIAVGHFDPAVLTPRSKRMPAEEIFVRHG